MAVERVITLTGDEMEVAMMNSHKGKPRVYTQAEIDALDPVTFGVGSFFREDGVEHWSDGVSFTPTTSAVPAVPDTTNPLYAPNGGLQSVNINGSPYVFAYVNGKVSTVVGGGVTKNITWAGNKLQSMGIN